MDQGMSVTYGVVVGQKVGKPIPASGSSYHHHQRECCPPPNILVVLYSDDPPALISSKCYHTFHPEDQKNKNFKLHCVYGLITLGPVLFVFIRLASHPENLNKNKQVVA